MFDKIIENINASDFTLNWVVSGENNGKPIHTWEGYGHKLQVYFDFSNRWCSMVDQSGEVFPEGQEEEALKSAVDRLKEKMLARVTSAKKTCADMALLAH